MSKEKHEAWRSMQEVTLTEKLEMGMRLNNIRLQTPFMRELIGRRTINVNGKDMLIAHWNLIVSTRDLKLWKSGMKPHRNWFVSDVKAYFGLQGNREKLVKQIEFLNTTLLE